MNPKVFIATWLLTLGVASTVGAESGTCDAENMAIQATQLFNAGQRSEAIALALAAEASFPFSRQAQVVLAAAEPHGRPVLQRAILLANAVVAVATTILGAWFFLTAVIRRPYARSVMLAFVLTAASYVGSAAVVHSWDRVVAAASVRLRVLPEAGANAIATVAAGSVGLRQQVQGDFALVAFGSERGWVAGENLLDAADARARCR